jgi:hypothetical protein
MFIFGVKEIVIGSILLIVVLVLAAGRSTVWVLERIGSNSMKIGWPVFGAFLISYSSIVALVAYQVVV